ncbi:MAG: hypothetical protein HYV35_04935 [Lentisphaerae bacterium]|nr:hypothetical protein [Lentisphaerota bacterium]
MNFIKRPLIRQIAGWTLLAIGVVGIIIPVLPGWLFLGAGALILAPYVRAFRRLAAWLHIRFPGWRGRLRRFQHFPPKADPPPVDKIPPQPPVP